MSRNRGHIPIRTCICCGAKREKKALIRLVLDENGVGMSGVTVDLIMGNTALPGSQAITATQTISGTTDTSDIVQVVSGSNGQFDYNGIDPSIVPRVQLHLTDYPESPYLPLEVAEGLRYLVEFRAQQPAGLDNTP